MRIIYIPMDERPCNYKFPSIIATAHQEVELIEPGMEVLGDKKKAADIERVWEFLEKNIQGADFAILSLDMLYYGGLIPSRLHHFSRNDLQRKIARLKKIHTSSPSTKIIAFESIMRSPNHDTSEEEPDYYAEYGYSLHRRAFLQDKKAREGIDEEEEKQLETLEIPTKIIDDYEDRRNINLEMNVKTLTLLKDKTLDFLVFPQDDSAPYGYTARAQQEVLSAIQEMGVEEQTRIYPGSDEVGCSLLARAYLLSNNLNIAVFPFYSSILGPNIVPLYEDRPMFESLKSHFEVCGIHLASSLSEADCVLAINSPGKRMIEASDQESADVSYSTYRNLTAFIDNIEYALNIGKQVAVSDSAYANGGDLSLLRRLDERGLLNKICAYAGWNTNCNTLGTVLSSLIFNFKLEEKKREYQLVYRIVEDIIYQSDVRQKIVENFLPTIGASYFDLLGKDKEVCQEIQNEINISMNRYHFLRKFDVSKIQLPWHRMFEINMEFEPF